MKSAPTSGGLCDSVREVLARGWHRQAPKIRLSPFEGEASDGRVCAGPSLQHSGLHIVGPQQMFVDRCCVVQQIEGVSVWCFPQKRNTNLLARLVQ